MDQSTENGRVSTLKNGLKNFFFLGLFMGSIVTEACKAADPSGAGDAITPDKTQNTSVNESPHHFALRTSPMGLLFGIWNIEGEGPISNSIELGPRFSYFQNEDISSRLQFSAYEIGISMSWHLFDHLPPERGLTAGWIIKSGLSFLPFSTTNLRGRRPQSRQAIVLQSTIGYQWVTSFRVNYYLGAGLAETQLFGSNHTFQPVNWGLQPVFSFLVGFSL